MARECPQVWGKWLLLWASLACLLAPLPAYATLRVSADVPGAGLRSDDRVLALRGVRGADDELVFPAEDPLGFDRDWLRCSALRRCQVQIERNGEELQRPLWIDEVPLRPELEPELLALIDTEEDTPELDTAWATQAAAWSANGHHGLAGWLQFRRIQRAVRRGDLDTALELERDLAPKLHERAPGHAWQLQLNLSLMLQGQGHAGLAAQRLDAMAAQDLPVDMRVRVARSRAGMAFAQSRLAEAEAILREVEGLARREAPASHLLASTLNSLAVVIRPQGRLQEARVLFEQAEEAARAFAADSVLEGLVRSNLGLLERAAGDLAAAERSLRQALELFLRLQHREELVFDTQSNLALVLLDRGRTREAAALFSLQIPSADPAQHLDRAGRAQQNLALVYAQQGNLHEAVRRLRLALAHWQGAAPDGLEEANTRLDLGWYAAQIGELDEAGRVLERALELHRKIAPAGTGVIGALDAQAMLALLQGQLEAALHIQQEALARRDQSEQPNWRRDIALTQLGRILLGLNRHREALAVLSEARSIAQAGGREGILALALATEGEILLKDGQPREARNAACRGVEHVEELRGTSPSGAEFRSGFVRTAAPVYRSCLDALLANRDSSAALDLYQSERRMALYALIADRDLRFADLPADLSAERRTAVAELQQVTGELEQIVEAESAQQARERLQQIRQRLRRLDARIIEAIPRLGSWRVQASAAPTRATAGERVLAFSVREQDTLRILLTPDEPPQIEVLAQDRQQIAEAVTAWRAALTRREEARERELASLLHAWLIVPGDDEDELATLTIVPDGPLHALPFAALLDDRGRRLIQTHSVRLSALLPDTAPWTAGSSATEIDLLALADTGSAEGGQRPALPGVDAELAMLAELPWPRIELLRGSAASPEALQRLGPQARRVHFAVHGLNDPLSPLDSALMLRDGDGRPSRLAVWDIFETLRLDAELVVLAACDTAPGAGALDDGWLGLTRAFQFAGASAVVSALWPVDDGGTASLMGEFHRQLAAGVEPAQALALSQRRMLQAGQEAKGGTTRGVGGLVEAGGGRSPATDHPYYWAGFHLYLAPR